MIPQTNERRRYLPLGHDSTLEAFSGGGERSIRFSIPTKYALAFRVATVLTLLLVTAWALNVVLLSPNGPPREVAEDGRPIVHTVNGTYAGIYLNSLNQDVFLGMPYAVPPLGSLRFRHPRPLKDTWDGVRDAVAYGPQCPGYGNDFGTFTHAEDCLTINVIRPVNAQKSLLPVAVYIYGAGVKVGGSDNQRYNLSFIVKTASDAGLPFIGVSFTYRASVGGWIISRQVRGSGETNIGFHDQRMALMWIQENISSFGGDPRKVTLWGGSSGARDVAYHLTAYGGRDDKLFRGAIMQSGCAVEETSSRRFPAQELYDALVAETSCSGAEDSLDCLRNIPYAEVNTAFATSKYGLGAMANVFGGPSIDGGFLSNYGSLSLKNARVVKVPVISGIVSNEGSNQIPTDVRDWSDLREYLIDWLLYPKSVVDELMSLYPPIARGSDDQFQPPIDGISISSKAEFDRIERLMGDLSNNAGARLTCESYAEITGCYAFRFAATVSSIYDDRLGVRHGAEIGPVFQNFDGIGWDVNPFAGKGENLRHMSRVMGIMWAGFITSLDPNIGFSQNDLNWPKYSVSGRHIMVFHQNGSWVETGDRRSDALDYINAIQDSIFER